jgi:hypothetical protein
MSDIRALFAGLGDLYTELTVLGRYLLTVIDQEIELLQIAARTPAGLSDYLDTAYAALVDGLTELAGWIDTWGPHRKSSTLAALGVNSLLGARMATKIFGRNDTTLDDADYLTEWTAVLAARIQTE